jgi:hypothetical protein
MKAIYEKIVVKVVYVSDDIVKTSAGGWQEGDNDLSWED